MTRKQLEDRLERLKHLYSLTYPGEVVARQQLYGEMLAVIMAIAELS